MTSSQYLHRLLTTVYCRFTQKLRSMPCKYCWPQTIVISTCSETTDATKHFRK